MSNKKKKIVHLNSHGKNKNSNKHLPYRNRVLVGEFNRFIYTLGANIEKHIQFDHKKNLETFCGHRTSEILKETINTVLMSRKYTEEENILDAIVNSLEEVSRICSLSENSFFNSGYKIKIGRLTVGKYDVVNLKRALAFANISRLESNLIVPKNTDLSTEEYRKFEVKPFFVETLLGFILVSNLFNNPDADYRDSYKSFGSAIISDSQRKKSYDFTKYIDQYNLFKEEVDYNLSRFSVFKYFDIKSFFSSIDHSLIADLICDNLRHKRRKSNLVSSNTNKLILECLGYIGEGSGKGLSIESHLQHTLAAVAIDSLIKDSIGQVYSIINNSLGEGRSTPNHPRFAVVSYVDDFYIFANSETELKIVFNHIENILLGNGFSIAEDKVSEILSTEDETFKIKELVRLPAVSYLEFVINEDESEAIRDILHISGNTDVSSDVRDKVAYARDFFANGGRLSELADSLSVYRSDSIHLLYEKAKNFPAPIARIIKEAYSGIHASDRSSSIMKLKDIDYWVENRETFIFTPRENAKFEYSEFDTADKLLTKLQYYYLTGLTARDKENPVTVARFEQEILFLSEALMVDYNFGSKARFLSGIIKGADSKLKREGAFTDQIFSFLLSESIGVAAFEALIAEYEDMDQLALKYAAVIFNNRESSDMPA